MQFSAGQDVRLKNYGAQTSFYRQSFSMGVLKGSIFLFQYSYTSGTPLESSAIGELTRAISAGLDVRLKNKSFLKCKKMTTPSVHGHCIGNMLGQVWTGLDKSEQVGTTIFLNRESHTVQIWPTPKSACSFLTVPRSKLYDPPKWWKQLFVTRQMV